MSAINALTITAPMNATIYQLIISASWKGIAIFRSCECGTPVVAGLEWFSKPIYANIIPPHSSLFVPVLHRLTAIAKRLPGALDRTIDVWRAY